jgi:hypothetical protein
LQAIGKPIVRKCIVTTITEFQVNTTRTLDSTKLMKQPKALENLYYMKLMTTTPAYAKNGTLWLNWYRMGFGTNIREGPPAINRNDRAFVDTEPGRRWVRLRLRSERPELNKAVEALALRAGTALMPQWKGKDEAGRLKILTEDKEIQTNLLNPVIAALKPFNLRAEEADRIIRAAQEGVLWLTDNDFSGLEVGDWTASETKAASRVGGA